MYKDDTIGTVISFELGPFVSFHECVFYMSTRCRPAVAVNIYKLQRHDSCVSSNILDMVISKRSPPPLPCSDSMFVSWYVCLLLFWYHILGTKSNLLCIKYYIYSIIVSFNVTITSENFTSLISTIKPVYFLYALTIGHKSDSDELKCYFNSHVVQDKCTPTPFPTNDPDVQQFFVLHLCMYFCMDLLTNLVMYFLEIN